MLRWHCCISTIAERIRTCVLVVTMNIKVDCLYAVVSLYDRPIPVAFHGAPASPVPGYIVLRGRSALHGVLRVGVYCRPLRWVLETKQQCKRNILFIVLYCDWIPTQRRWSLAVKIMEKKENETKQVIWGFRQCGKFGRQNGYCVSPKWLRLSPKWLSPEAVVAKWPDTLQINCLLISLSQAITCAKYSGVEVTAVGW